MHCLSQAAIFITTKDQFPCTLKGTQKTSPTTVNFAQSRSNPLPTRKHTETVCIEKSLTRLFVIFALNLMCHRQVIMLSSVNLKTNKFFCLLAFP